MSNVIGHVLDMEPDEGIERFDSDLLIGVTDFDKTGMVELNLDYQDTDGNRNDVYVRFKLSDLLAAIGCDYGTDVA